jgi:hypothetical protein
MMREMAAIVERGNERASVHEQEVYDIISEL